MKENRLGESVDSFWYQNGPGEEGRSHIDVKRTEHGCWFTEEGYWGGSAHEFTHARIERLIIALAKCLPPDRLRRTAEKLVALLPAREPERTPRPLLANRRVLGREQRQHRNGQKTGGK